MAINVNRLSFDDVDLHKWAPGFESGIKGKWAEHPIIGASNALQEDQGDGVLNTTVRLEITDDKDSGQTARQVYNNLVIRLTQRRRGTLVHPLRGSRESILDEIKESMQWTTQGNIITLQITFKDAATNVQADYRDGDAAAAQAVRLQAENAQQGASDQQTRVFSRSSLNLVARRYALDALDRVNQYAAAATSYAQLAVEANSGGLLQLATLLTLPPGVTPTGATQGQTIRASLRLAKQVSQALRLLPASMQAASDAVRLSGSVAEVQPTINALEMSLAAATRLDAAIQAALPVPITFTVEFPLSIYQIAQERYAGMRKTPQQLRALVQVMLAMNPQLHSPERVPVGTRLVRPAA
jgi:hypothetical protein